jgi:hypothetical protein
LLDDFINQYMRNHHIWLTVAHQSLYQIDEQLRQTLLSLGTYVFGQVATMSEARLLADVLFKRDPYVVKHWRKVWGSAPVTNAYSGRIIGTSHFVLDHEPEFMPLEEQQERFAQRINEQKLFEFLLRPALREGEVSNQVIPVSIAHAVLDSETNDYQIPDQHAVATLRALLTVQTGIPLKTLLAEQDARLARGLQPRLSRQQSPQAGRLPQGRQASTRHTGNDPIPEEPTPAHAAADQPFTPSQPSHRRREQVT